MSSDIYIPLWLVLSQPGHFDLKAVCNVDVETAREEAASADPNWDYVEACLEPMLMCRFGHVQYRPVDITEDQLGVKELHVSVGGGNRKLLCDWLDGHNYRYTMI
jgi:hypothetical protein